MLAAFLTAQVDHLGRTDVLDRLVGLLVHHPAQLLEDLRDPSYLPTDGVDPLRLHRQIALAREAQQIALVSDLTNYSREYVIMKFELRLPFETDIDKVRKVATSIFRRAMATLECR